MENVAQSKMHGYKLKDIKMRHKTARVENVRHEKCLTYCNEAAMSVWRSGDVVRRMNERDSESIYLFASRGYLLYVEPVITGIGDRLHVAVGLYHVRMSAYASQLGQLSLASPLRSLNRFPVALIGSGKSGNVTSAEWHAGNIPYGT